MMWLDENLLSYRRRIQPAAGVARLESVTTADVLDIARRVLNPRRLSVAMVSPGDVTRHTDMIRQKIARLG